LDISTRIVAQPLVLVSHRGLFCLDAEEADGGVEKMKINLNVATVVAAFVVLGTASLGDQSGMVELTSAKTFSIQNLAFREIMSGATDVLTSDGVPGMPEARMVVHDMEGGVVCLDASGNVLRTRRTGRLEISAVSPDGGTLAIIGRSTVGFPGTSSTERELTWLRVERLTGELIWERRDGLGIEETESAIPFVTGNGYVVVSPNVHPPDRPYKGGKITRPLIFDPNGELVTELPARYYTGRIALSRDGAYCAINFADLDAESPLRCSGNQESARQCVALFEVSAGRELWRHYFAQCDGGSVALTEGGERVICGVQEGEWAPPRERHKGWYSLRVFDRQGKMISRVETKGPLSPFFFSPNEKCCAFAEFDSGIDHIGTVDPLDGRTIACWSCEPLCHAHVISVSDAADVCVSVRTSHPSERMSSTYHWVLIDGEGVEVYQESYDQDKRPYVALSADRKALRKIWKGGVTEYALED
jgi:hypothetical protein